MSTHTTIEIVIQKNDQKTGKSTTNDIDHSSQ